MCSEHIREPAVSPDQGADVVKGDVQAPEQADLPQGLQIGVRVISVAVLIPGRDEKSFGFIKRILARVIPERCSISLIVISGHLLLSFLIRA